MTGLWQATGKILSAESTKPDFMSNLSSVFAEYEAEQARVCAKYPACATDQGAMTRFVPTALLYSPNHNLLNVAGLHKVAELVWPIAEKQAQ